MNNGVPPTPAFHHNQVGHQIRSTMSGWYALHIQVTIRHAIVVDDLQHTGTWFSRVTGTSGHHALLQVVTQQLGRAGQRLHVNMPTAMHTRCTSNLLAPACTQHSS